MSRHHDAIEKARKEGTVAKPRPAETLPPITSTGGISFVEGAPVTPQIEGCLVNLMTEDAPWLEQMRTLATRLRSMEGSERVRRKAPLEPSDIGFLGNAQVDKRGRGWHRQAQSPTGFLCRLFPGCNDFCRQAVEGALARRGHERVKIDQMLDPVGDQLRRSTDRNAAK